MRRVWTTHASDGVTVAVHDLEGAGRPAVLVHANGFHARVLAALARELGSSLDCFGPDLRGHGLSGVPVNLDFSWSGFGRDVLAAVDLIDALDDRPPSEVARPVGFGHSLGGTALLLAEAARPGTFAAIYCYEPILVPPERRKPIGTPNPLSGAARRRRDEFASRDDAIERYRARPLFAALDPEVLANYVEFAVEDTSRGTVRLRCRPEHEALIFEYAYASDALDHLDEVHCPVTIAVGERSTGDGRAGAIHAIERLPLACSVEIPALGHLGPLESPAVVAGSVLACVIGSNSAPDGLNGTPRTRTLATPRSRKES